jgi:hypothetical protein
MNEWLCILQNLPIVVLFCISTKAIALAASEQLLLGKLTHGLLGRKNGQGFFFPGSRDERAARQR